METKYLSGFGNHFSTEARPGALPADQNSPQKAPHGLYPEQLSGSAFTAPRHTNLYSWLYRIRPSVQHKPFVPLKDLTAKTFFKPQHINPNQMRWNPLKDSSVPQDFVEGIRTVCGAGSALEQRGLSAHLYSFSKDMGSRYFMNADGDFLLVPQKGSLHVKTEMGLIEMEPGEIAVIPRGMKFQINPLKGDLCTGYIGENFGAPFRLPDLGPIGANGLAHRRHFLTPVAAFEDLEGKFELIGKFAGELWSAEMGHSPLDVVAWHGNYAPYKYDLRKFNTINTVSYDHPDPSIFTVLTSPSDTPGIANVDFAIFPPRWMVGEHTFRPPYFHRNCMSEYMGLIYGEYDAKTAGGFVPGGGSLHNFYSAHGPDVDAFEKASHVDLKPHKIEATMAFMFECRSPYMVTDFAMEKDFLQSDYQDCWQGFKKYFK
ncbi:homogentisate 1,2-dioxygenase [Bdellovibrio bacteriovorus]|uniref:homogentisate 1,2-dioxygenase n=1 Tax=Bdellovibrio bacteriovorus TaxID=959 RepID=UPI0021D0BA88|nr:homogentisate 1,2-dioxygenase [Bdellovibrio bacteriovorus]UXR64443.1 homogentisate 1,2-dioxygenase [Bdellovibrio bacteriovorus]